MKIGEITKLPPHGRFDCYMWIYSIDPIRAFGIYPAMIRTDTPYMSIEISPLRGWHSYDHVRH